MNSRIRGQELPIFDGIMAFLIKKRRIYMKIRKLLSLSLVVTLVVLMLGSIPAMAEEPMSTEKWAEKAHKNPAGIACQPGRRRRGLKLYFEQHQLMIGFYHPGMNGA